MSLKTAGTCCARCHAYLFEEDDIVYCPVCGAPHHRDCYNALGHCALEELHGTEKQYSRENEEKARAIIEQKDAESKEAKEDRITTCRMCGEKFDKEIRLCPKCKTPNLNHFDGYVQFDLLGGIPADMDIGEGVTAEEAKRFVAANPQRYIPKFVQLNNKNKASWNWMAFLFPSPWMLSRKMYKCGIFSGIFCIISTLLSYPLSLALYSIGIDEIQSQADMMQRLAEKLPEIGLPIILASVIAIFVELAVRIICGIFGDYWYKQYTISSIKTIRSQSHDADFDYRKKGGVNFYLFLLGLLALQYIPTIIANLL